MARSVKSLGFRIAKRKENSAERAGRGEGEGRIVLGIEGGGTRTVALFVRCPGDSVAGALVVSKQVFGPGNLKLLTDSELRELFEKIAAGQPRPAAIGIGLAGARSEEDRRRIRLAAEKVWGDVPVTATHDLAIALAAFEGSEAKVLVLSGTGSCCYGRTERGIEAKSGGWGHLLGDRGSGYAIALNALRAAIREFDGYQKSGKLLRGILRHLLLNEPEQLIAWAQDAAKDEVASIAPVVFDAARQHDPQALKVIEQAAVYLAADAISCARKLKTVPTVFVFAGSVLLGQPRFMARIAALIREEYPNAAMQRLEREGAWGAVALALQIANSSASPEPTIPSSKQNFYVPTFRPEDSPTEQRNAASRNLDQLSPRGIVQLMLDEEKAVVPALKDVIAEIQEAAAAASRTLKNGGRIFYVGAGTSGRLGVLDASECPPTFRANPEMVQGIIAGGQRALWQAVEGAEDDPAAGANAVRSRGVTARDIVIGIAASGRTPFVWGALQEANRVRAKTVLICFNPALEIAAKHRPDIVIAANVGPEVLTGSTRLKSGTATKLILNMISTIAMIRLGKVASNLMIDVNASNVKLRDRAIRILSQLSNADAETARTALEKNGWVIRKAWKQIRKAPPSRTSRLKP